MIKYVIFSNFIFSALGLLGGLKTLVWGFLGVLNPFLVSDSAYGVILMPIQENVVLARWAKNKG